MPHWSSAFVGRAYQEGVFDCGELARCVQREVFGREVRIPAERDYALAGSPREKFAAMTAQIQRLKDDIARRVDVPQEGDAVLLVARGYRQHVGVSCFIEGERWVLHASDGSRQVVLQRERDLALRGLGIEGYYRWT